MFDGRNLYVDVEVSFNEIMQKGGIKKEIVVARENICSSCNGTREEKGSHSLVCYSCKGEGTKRDAIFNKEVRCNTCKGHGKLVQKPCKTCDGTGLVMSHDKIEITIERFTQDGECIEMPLQGHRTLFGDKGKNGSLFATVRIVEEIDRWRDGADVFTKHYVRMGDAIEGCSVSIPTIHGAMSVQL